MLDDLLDQCVEGLVGQLFMLEEHSVENRHRWIIERTIAWFGAFRRLVVRYERSTRMFLAFFQFAAVLIALRRL